MSNVFYSGLGNTTTWPQLPPGATSPTSLTYSDVLLIPQPNTTILSRKKVDLSTQFGPYKLSIPIISAPMDTVTGEDMIRTLHELGGIGTLPRSRDPKVNYALCEKLSKDNIRCVYAVGLKGFAEAKELKKRGAKIILVDIAHGGIEQVKKLAGDIKDKLGLTIIAGNIATYPQAIEYKKAGIDIARVGVGPGAVCSTRQVAGVGMGQLSAVLDTSAAGIYAIADGGIKYPGDAAKALAAGANMVMIGSMLGGTDESPGDVVDGKKVLRGQASRSYMQDNGVNVSAHRAAEGIETTVPYKGSVANIINDITGGIRSACSYSGANNIQELQQKAIFSIVSGATQIENRPHILLQK